MTLTYRQNELLAPYTTLHVGGVADCVVVVESEEELAAALVQAQEFSLPPLILGSGSNVLINDSGYRGLVVINRLSGIFYESQAEEVFVTVGSGVILDELVATLAAAGYWGLENLGAIPGTVGATPVQNVGAYGVEVSDRITAVTAVHRRTLESRVFTNTACHFGYRDSFFKSPVGKEWVITKVTFRVTKQYTPVLSYRDLASLLTLPSLTPETVRQTVVAIRSKKFPDWRTVGTAGSFFKNPTIEAVMFHELTNRYPDLPGYQQSDGRFKVSLGWILEHICELKGFRDGMVRLFEAQALVLVAERGATASQIDSFATLVAEKIFSHTGIIVEREVQKI